MPGAHQACDLGLIAKTSPKTRPGGMLTLDGYMHGSGGADGVANSEADSRMPEVYTGAQNQLTLVDAIS